MNIRRKRHGRLSALGLTLLFAVLIATGIVVGIGGRVLWESREPGKPDVCAFLHVSPCESTLLASDARPPSEREFEIYKNTQRQLVKSPVVLTAALADSAVNRLPSLQREGPVAWLAEELEVSFPGDAEIMLIGMSGHDPKESVAIVNAVVSAYVESVVNADRSRRMGRMAELERLYANKEAEVQRKRRTLHTMLKNLGVEDEETTAHRQRLAIEELTSYSTELVRMRSDLARLNAQLKVQEGLLAEVDEMEFSNLELNSLLRLDPIAQRIMERLVPTAGPGRYQEDSGELLQQLGTMRDEARTELRRRQRAEMETAIKQTTLEIAAFSEQIKGVEEQRDRIKRAAEKFSGSFIELEMGREQLRQMEDVLRKIGTEREKAALEMKSRPRVTIVQLAEVPR